MVHKSSTRVLFFFPAIKGLATNVKLEYNEKGIKPTGCVLRTGSNDIVVIDRCLLKLDVNLTKVLKSAKDDDIWTLMKPIYLISFTKVRVSRHLFSLVGWVIIFFSMWCCCDASCLILSLFMISILNF